MIRAGGGQSLVGSEGAVLELFGPGKAAEPRKAPGKIAKEKPFDEANVKKAKAIAERFKGTESGERAQHFVDLSKVKLEI